MNELQIFELVLPVLVPVVVGWLAVRVKLLKVADAHPLTTAYLYIFLPALIVEHLAREGLTGLFDLRFIVATLALMLGIYGAVLGIHLLILRRSLVASTLAAFGAAKFNAVIIGLPLLLIAIGKAAIPAAALNMVIGYFTILPLTLFLLEFAKARESGDKADLRAVAAKAFLHTIRDPLIVATLVGLGLALLHVTLPGWIDDSLLGLGQAAVPVPLIAVGMSIDGAMFRGKLGEALWISAVRVIVSPLLAIAIAKSFGLSPVYAIALVISFGLPTAKMAFALAEEHEEYAKTMAAIVTITTLSMAVLYPILIWICEREWPGAILRVI